ncbi:hypothetical protein V8F33_011831 [Rhypophila sp. PSN 637]
MAPNKSMIGGGLVPIADKIKEDAFFDKSPFNSMPIVQLQFRQGDPFSVHQALLQRYPKLLRFLKHGGVFHQKVLSLNHISRSGGHVLVNYLYTGTYQTLDWTGPATGNDETIAKLRTSFEVYATARQFELYRLEELTKEQISLLSQEIDAFTVVDVVSEAYPTSSGNDTWFLTYMKVVIRTAFEGAQARSKSEASEIEREGDIPTAKTLFRGAVEVYREMMESLAVKGVKEVPVALEEPARAPPERSRLEDANTWGFEAAKDTKREVEYAVELEPETEPEPAPDLALMPEGIVPGPENNDTCGVGTAKTMLGKKGKKKMIKRHASGSQPEPEPPSIREPAKTEDNTTASNHTGAWGPFGISSSTTSTLFSMKSNDVAVGSTPNASAGNNTGARSLFDVSTMTSTPFGTCTANNDAAVSGAPGTAFPAFTPMSEREGSYETICFQNILSMDAYREWSSEKLRLAGYSQGHK